MNVDLTHILCVRLESLLDEVCQITNCYTRLSHTSRVCSPYVLGVEVSSRKFMTGHTWAFRARPRRAYGQCAMSTPCHNLSTHGMLHVVAIVDVDMVYGLARKSCTHGSGCAHKGHHTLLQWVVYVVKRLYTI